MAATRRILVLIDRYTTDHNKNWTFFHDALQAQFDDSIGVTMGALYDLSFVLTPAGDRIYDRAHGFSLDDFDLVVFRFVRQEHARAAACASFLQRRGIRYIDRRVQPGSYSKYAAGVARYGAGLPIIASAFGTNALLEDMIAAGELPFGFPMIIKDVNGRKGRLNFMVRSVEEVREIFAANPDTQFIAQEFIPNDGDYRLLVVGSQVRLAIHRRARNASHLNNTSQGAEAVLLEPQDLPPEMVAIAERAAALEQLDVAGVDVMCHCETGRYHILEVNASPQLATGAFPERKLAAYADYLRTLLDAP